MYTKDRLPELKIKVGSQISNDSVQIELHVESDEKMQKIFKEIEKIRAWIHDISQRTKTMKILYSEPTFQNSKQMQEEMESNMTMCTALGLKVCGALKEFQDKINAHEEGDVFFRIIHLQYITTNKLYCEALNNHENFLNKYKESRMKLLQHQIKLTNESITEEECQSLLESNNLSIFVDNIEAETREAQLALQDVESRHREILKIENALREVRDIFLQMATLVHQQQDLINTVEYFANQASNHVDTGNTELQKGVENKKKGQKKQIFLICLLAAVLLIIFVAIFT